MKLINGLKAPAFRLTDIHTQPFDSENLKGKRYLLTFYRFASCPFCNLRLHQVINEYKKYADEFEVVAVFDAKLENLQKYAPRHQAPFPILADEDKSIHRLYQIEHSFLGVLKGMVFRFPSLMLAMLKGYIPWRIKGEITAMPADFLIDENGIIQTAYYGKDEGDHIALHRVKQFAQRRDIIDIGFQEV